MDRDELARHLYVHFHDQDGGGAVMQRCGAEEWDTGQAKAEDRAQCYAMADQLIAEGRVPA